MIVWKWKRYGNMRYLNIFVILFFLFSLLGAQDTLQIGKKFYESACLPCHGVEGDGRGPAAKGLNPMPKDLTTGWYKFRSTPHGQMPTDEDIYKTISKGVPRTMMPPFEHIFNEDEIFYIIEYIKTFTNRFERWGPGDPIQIPREIPMTPQTVAEGEKVYRTLKCWECHGIDGRGKGPISSQLKDDTDTPIKAFDFTLGIYKAGSENRDIYKTFNTGLSGTPMGTFYDAFLFTKDDFEDVGSYRDYFSEEQMKDFLSYVSTLPGREEMEALSDKKREELANKRRWALVHYVKSLTRKKGWIYKLFFEDVEVAR